MTTHPLEEHISNLDTAQMDSLVSRQALSAAQSGVPQRKQNVWRLGSLSWKFQAAQRTLLKGLEMTSTPRWQEFQGQPGPLHKVPLIELHTGDR